MNQRKVANVLVLLNRQGFELTRVRGSHHRFSDNHGHKVTVPYTSEAELLAPKTYAAILQQMGLR
ncbi:type II toxin-antitoxin system HicA family toxin [Schleiferilactobacillus shenzhenensis]|uniref:YcfA n=1 Tax=Schleiferilactobacillus shenzhenensis LY-73 TaxID=1231336 RepID=U4TPR1_9LACO|nr:type II toxin-antitoxin system HicA family toxin [Schleiferilactobacillus shenzhenensis]ERL65430.1 hypothetical protein L248_2829 [Schleiferilactobacillus shenzhenensis LY-73]